MQQFRQLEQLDIDEKGYEDMIIEKVITESYNSDQVPSQSQNTAKKDNDSKD